MSPARAMLTALLPRLRAAVKSDTITGRDGDVYMERFHLLTFPDGGHVRLHRIARSDLDHELHDHPWHAVSLILAGSYREERRVGEPGAYEIVSRVYLPSDVNHIGADDYHRLELITPEVWSLFVTGPKLKSWSFWDRDTGVVTPWREFLRAKGVPAAALTEG